MTSTDRETLRPGRWPKTRCAACHDLSEIRTLFSRISRYVLAQPTRDSVEELSIRQVSSRKNRPISLSYGDLRLDNILAYE